MDFFESKIVKFIGHRGFQPLAPENSLPSFEYSGKLGHWAIETDLHVAKDGQIVCCHNDCINETFNGVGEIKQLTYSQLLNYSIVKGNRVNCFCSEQLKIPTLEQYLSICKKYGSIPFIELKTNEVELILKALYKNDFNESNTILSSTKLEPLLKVRQLNEKMFIHWIFADINKLKEYASLKNCGISLNYSNATECPINEIELVKSHGVKICLRACDNYQTLRYMQKIGLDYFPTNCMHE
jgi:glycerophosphoryl diester phosphodiesterase